MDHARLALLARAAGLVFVATRTAASCRLGESLDSFTNGQAGASTGGTGGSGGGARAAAVAGHGRQRWRGTGGAGGSAGSGGTGGSGGPPVYGIPRQSCNGMTGTECQGKSCCESIVLPGGTFPMGRSTTGTDACPSGMTCESSEQPEHDATVSSFALDTYEVTVGRFRKFVEQYGTPPPDGSGAHPLIAGTGWQSAWNASLPPSQAALITNLKCDSTYHTWTDAAAGNEQYTINCVDWYEAFAFCVWDGGRLPTEAEWEYAAAGGDANRLYPWGSEDPSVNTALANDSYSDASPFINVGSHPLGAARWGHQDLAGGMYEWAFDWFDVSWYGEAGNTCNHCVNITHTSYRVPRGGSWLGLDYVLRAAARLAGGGAPTGRNIPYGFRCARGQ